MAFQALRLSSHELTRGGGLKGIMIIELVFVDQLQWKARSRAGHRLTRKWSPLLYRRGVRDWSFRIWLELLDQRIPGFQHGVCLISKQDRLGSVQVERKREREQHVEM